jgi:two-component system, LuxR family, sensor kinase FixL
VDKDYSVRARKQSEDEVGQLIDGFNEMLGQIQQRDSALESARDNLERRVEARTKELAASLSLLNATLNSTADGILALDLSGRIVCYNEKFALLWGIPVDVLTPGSNESALARVVAQVKGPARFRQRIKEMLDHPETEAFDLVELKDGRTFERFIQPQRVGNECAGCVLNFRDITERKLAESKLEAVHRELLLTSRQAGMAEVATNVLHNVGNVLNSVNTSASVVTEQIRASKITGLTRMADLFEAHRPDLAGFLTRENRADQVIHYLKTLAEHLASEQKTVLNELSGLGKNIEHIKEIVAMQQSYAKVSGVEEIHSVPALVEDALRIHANALERHGVRVVRSFDPVPEILVDKHKVLQILVNLIRAPPNVGWP